MNLEPIGLGPEEHRCDFQLREVFVEAFKLVSPHLDDQGNWVSLAHEIHAHDALIGRFPEFSGLRLFAVLATITSVRAAGRTPV